MKANRAFRRDDDAVSPVIAVILMVAITVVLAATVYVWVSGFGAQSSQPAKTMSLTSAGTLTTSLTLDLDAGDSQKPYSVASAAPGMRYGDITVSVDGVTATMSTGNCDTTYTDLASNADGVPAWIACSGAFSSTATARTTTSTVSAGDYFYVFGDDTSIASKTLRVLDTQANSVILTLTIG